MDPPLVNEVSFTAASNPSSYSLAGLLSFPARAGGLGLRMGSLGGGDGSIEESTVTEQNGGNGGAKRRRDVGNSFDDGSSKIVSAINANQDLARREKISERMKILQDLVPGCNKVIGKALVLDEIINYVQSLQRQVEFLSMKLEAVNSRLSPTIDEFPSKDLAIPPFDANGMLYGSQAPGEYARGSLAEWLHMQVGSAWPWRLLMCSSWSVGDRSYLWQLEDDRATDGLVVAPSRCEHGCPASGLDAPLSARLCLVAWGATVF
ncbi:hypothetical protein DH2020_042798 [Rehmannia glutinosa]|uniref:BHLH domain-containing protein n=1 Tax=Rehmannia glutinosa TaxID=99300 RepID=A0ABR0UMP6_REHGL